jgi:hypothetical protein
MKPAQGSVFIRYHGRITHYFCFEYVDRQSLVDRVKRDYGYSSSVFDTFHGSIEDKTISTDLTLDRKKQITFIEVRA